MSPAFALALLACLPHIIKAVTFIWRGGKKEGSEEQLSLQQARALQLAVDELKRRFERGEDMTRKEIDELVKAVSENSDMHNQLYRDLYKDFSELKFLVGRLMKNGGHP